MSVFENTRFDLRRVEQLALLEWCMLAYGVLLRLTQYFSGRSLWMDESLLSLNIVNRSFAQLLRPLENDQGAPVGFLMVQRASVQLFGPNEYALRLFPLLCGLASLFLFYYLAKKCLDRKAVPIAIALFAILLPLIYYSSEAKQYSSDVAVALCLLCIAAPSGEAWLTRRRMLLLGLAGAFAIWFSHPATFVLAGIGGSMLVFCVMEKRWRETGPLSIVLSAWLVSFGVCYFVSLRTLAANKTLLNYWNFSFPPAHPLSVAGVEWFLGTFFGMFQSPGGFDLSGLAALAFLVGFAWYWKDRPRLLGVLILPIFFTLIAAGFHKYPFSGRLLLFVMPALLLLVANGAQHIWLKTRQAAPFLGTCFIGLLFLYPVLFSVYHLFKPNNREEIKPAMSYIRSHEQPGDAIYVQYGAIPAFRYYLPQYRTPAMNVVQGSVWEQYPSDVNRVSRFHRVWVLFAHLNIDTGIDEKTLLLDQLDQKGKRVDSFTSPGAAAYLYDFESPEQTRASGQ